MAYETHSEFYIAINTVYCKSELLLRSGKNMFWPIKNSGEVLSKLKDIGYQARVCPLMIFLPCTQHYPII